MNVGKNTTLGDCDVPKKLVQFFIVTNGKLKMARDDTRLLVIASGIASQLKDFSSEVFEYGGEIDGGTCIIKSDNEKTSCRNRAYQHQRAVRSFLFSKVGGHGRRGMRVRLWMSG